MYDRTEISVVYIADILREIKSTVTRLFYSKKISKPVKGQNTQVSFYFFLLYPFRERMCIFSQVKFHEVLV